MMYMVQTVSAEIFRQENGPVNSAKYKYEKQFSPLTLSLIKVNTRGSKIIKNNGHIHVHSSWAGADSPLDSFFFFKNINIVSIWSSAAIVYQ